MRIPSNKIKDIVRFAHLELDEIYDTREVRAMIYALIEAFCGIPFSKALSSGEQTVSESELLKVYFSIKDLKNYKPLQYIIGKSEFLNLDLDLSHQVLIPRVETEELVGRIIEENKRREGLRIADLGCGSGCIAISLAKNLPQSSVWAFDISPEALEQTRINAQRNAVQLQIVKGDILSGISCSEEFDIMVSNPPYVRQSEKTQMQRNVIDYEPSLALFVEDENPLIFYQSIALFAQKALKKGGKLYLEINEALGEQTKLIFTSLDYDCNLYQDLRGRDRMLFCQKK